MFLGILSNPSLILWLSCFWSCSPLSFKNNSRRVSHAITSKAESSVAIFHMLYSTGSCWQTSFHASLFSSFKFWVEKITFIKDLRHETVTLNCTLKWYQAVFLSKHRGCIVIALENRRKGFLYKQCAIVYMWSVPTGSSVWTLCSQLAVLLWKGVGP